LHRRRTITIGKLLPCKEFFWLGYIFLWSHLSCISTDILPATCSYAGAGCPSACTMDCRSASAWPSRPTVGRMATY